MFRRFICSIVHFLYKHLAKPLFFLSSPDDMHVAMIKFANYCGKIPFVRGFLRMNFKRRKNMLSQDVAGVHFSTPVGLAAGFDKNGEIIEAISCLDFGFEVVGSVTARQCSGNPRPWFYRLPKSKSAVINAGLPNDGAVTILGRIKRLPPRLVAKFPIILSVAKTNSPDVTTTQESIDDYVLTVKRAAEVGLIKMVEVNVSCPNAFGGEDFSSDPKLLDKLLGAIDDLHVDLPIFLKMPHGLSWLDFRKLLDVAIKHQINGVAIANLRKDRENAGLQDDLPDEIRGNLSGLPTQAETEDLIKRSYLYCGDKMTIIGVGGTFSGEDAYRKIRLGASMVQIITGLFFEGPQLAAQINDDLVRYLKRDGFSNISEAVGIDAKK